MKPLVLNDSLRTRICPKMVVAYNPDHNPYHNPSKPTYNTEPYKISINMGYGAATILLSYADKNRRDKDLDILDAMELNEIP